MDYFQFCTWFLQLSNSSSNQTRAVLIKKIETWHQHNLVVSDRVANIYFHLRNQGNNYLLVPGTSSFSLNENNFFLDF